MNDCETFATEADARDRISGMRGWDETEAVQFCLPDDPNADDEGNAWVIMAAGKYLRDDGYIR